ncbi:MAG: hypothetical protein ACOCZM_01610 [Bacillota bacterium]
MKKIEIKNISGHSTAMVVAAIISALSLLMFLIMGIPMGVTSIAAGTAMDINPLLFLLLGIFILMVVLVFYFVFTYLYVRLFCFLYNKLRPHVGGIKFSAEEIGAGGVKTGRGSVSAESVSRKEPVSGPDKSDKKSETTSERNIKVEDNEEKTENEK